MRAALEREALAGVSGAGSGGEEAKSLKGGHQAVEVSQAEEEVHLGKLGRELLSVPLDQTAHSHQRLTGSVLLESGRLQNRPDRFLLRGVDEPAGVDQHDLGFVEISRRLGSTGLERGEDSLGVDRVLVAAQADQAELHPWKRSTFGGGSNWKYQSGIGASGSNRPNSTVRTVSFSSMISNFLTR